eukprot:63565-Rhodomonas_salina.4
MIGQLEVLLVGPRPGPPGMRRTVTNHGYQNWPSALASSLSSDASGRDPGPGVVIAGPEALHHDHDPGSSSVQVVECVASKDTA